MFLRAAELVAYAVFVAAMVTQVIWPLLVGTPIFPFFRKPRAANLELGTARVQYQDSIVNREVERLRERARRRE